MHSLPAAKKATIKSVALRLEHGELRYLFASDIDKRDEALLLAQNGSALHSAVLKVPRHGSATASTAESVAAAKPQLAVISASARSRSEPQREEIAGRYRKAGAEVLRTYEDGAIIVESDGMTLRYQGYKSGKTGVIDLDCGSRKNKILGMEKEINHKEALGHTGIGLFGVKLLCCLLGLWF